MANIEINTSQNVNITFRIATTGKRVLAFLIDTIIKFFMFITISYMLNNSSGSFGFDGWSLRAIIIIAFSPIIFYSLLFEYFNYGKTPGKLLMKIKVVKIDGYQADFIDIFSRWAMRLVDISSSMGLLGIIAMSYNKNNQRLGDIVAGTTVIEVNNYIKLDQTIFEEIGNAYVPKYPMVINLSDNDIRIIKTNLNNAILTNNKELLMRLKERIEEILEIKSNEPPSFFIQTIIKDYNFYTQKSELFA